MIYTKDRFAPSFLASALLHGIFFLALYFAGLSAKEQIKPIASEPIYMSLADEKPEVPAEPAPQVPKKHEPIKQKHIVKQKIEQPIKERVAPMQPSPDAISAPRPQARPEQLQQASETKIEQQQKQVASAAKSDDKNSEVKKYLSKIRKKLQDNLEYPHFARKAGMEGIATVHFCIHRDGSIEGRSLKVLKSSGHGLLDSQAVETVRNSAPFAPPPDGEIEVSIPVSFSLT